MNACFARRVSICLALTLGACGKSDGDSADGSGAGENTTTDSSGASEDGTGDGATVGSGADGGDETGGGDGGGDTDGDDDGGTDDGGGTGDDGSTDSGTDDGGGTGSCGNGIVDGDEFCDDGNVQTELPPRDASDCIDDCSMVLETCGNGEVDPGEACDDGNEDSFDDCTTSCTVNDQGFHAPCRCEGSDCDDTDVSAGTIVGCDAVEVPAGAELGCFRSSNLFNVTQTYFAEGECGVISLVCTDSAVCPGDIGDIEGHTDCPDGTVLIEKHVDGPLGAQITSKVCQKVCESDADCRWNAYDQFWEAPGEYRCQAAAQSDGTKVCVDAQNNEI